MRKLSAGPGATSAISGARAWGSASKPESLVTAKDLRRVFSRFITARLHADRAAGRHRDHRGADRAALAGRPGRARGRAADHRASNNLKQIGIALHGYHDANNTFPAGGWIAVFGQPSTNNMNMGWSASVLPWLEQNVRLRRAESSAIPTTMAVNSTAAYTVLQVYLCPSEPRKTYWNQYPGPPPDPYPSADADYGGMYGPRALGSGFTNNPPAGADDLQPVHRPGADHRRCLADDRRRRGPRGDQRHVGQRPQHLRPVGPDQRPSAQPSSARN